MWFDSSLVAEIVESVPEWAVVPLLFVSYLGSIYVIGPTVAYAFVSERYSRGIDWIDRTAVRSWPVIVLGGYALFVALKPLFGVGRPPVDGPVAAGQLPTVLQPLYDRAVSFSTGSFPSGHAIASSVFWGLLVVDLRLGMVRRRLVGGILLICLIGFSRVALGTHYVGDVVGGIAIGLFFLGCALVVRRRVTDPLLFLIAVAGVPVFVGVYLGRYLDLALISVPLLILSVLYRRDHYEKQSVFTDSLVESE